MSSSRHARRFASLSIVCGLWLFALDVLQGAPSQQVPQDEAPKQLANHPQFSTEQLDFFEKRVRPILVERCIKCHGPEKQESGLRADSRAALLVGGDSGPAIVPGETESGYFVDAVRYGDIYQMPKDGKLPQEQIDDLVAWVKMGAPWPSETAPATAPSPKEEFDLRKRAQHWAFLPLSTMPPPAVKNASWSRTWVDDYIHAQLEEAGIDPSPETDRATWLRRVTFDLIGLPPTAEELREFLNDESSQAFERVVDRLLDSPHYGERWGRHWLDLVRYAETAGHEFDYDIPLAYKYRDYVIRSINADVPYDQFVREHIAGDLVSEPRRLFDGSNESIVATGFWWLGEGKHSPVDIRGEEADRMDNQLDVFGKAFLGLTIACARCHDHKFDAISTRDYYALAGYLQSSRYHEAAIDPAGPRQRAIKALAELLTERDRLLTTNFLASVDQQVLSRSLLAARAAVIVNSNERVESTLPSVSEADLQPWLDQKLEPEAARRWAAAGKVFELPSELLSRWRSELIAAGRQPNHPLHAWSAVALVGQPGAAGIECQLSFPQRWGDFAKHIRSDSKTSQADNFVELFADFSQGVPDDWFITEEAFGPTAASGESTAWSGSTPARAIRPEIVHSGRISRRLQGTLRSPTFEIRSPRIFYRLAGRGTKLNLIIDGFQRIRDPIYGGLTVGLNDDELRWHAQDVSKWIGHRAYIEIIDDGDGWAAIEQVCVGQKMPEQSPATSIARELVRNNSIDAEESLAAELVRQLVKPRSDGIIAWLANSGVVSSSSAATDELNALETQREKLDAQVTYGGRAMAMIDGSPVDEFVFLRGNHKTPGDLVHRRFLEAFSEQGADANLGSGRLELAERMTRDSQALLARVMVNRVWKHHFGRALAATPDNLGRLGDVPTHPELLDALAHRFIRGGWKLKPLHRDLVLSATYRQQSAIRPELAEQDPTNTLFHRMPVQRLEAEAIRDAILLVSGRLDLERMFGPSVAPHLTAFMQGRGRPGASGPLDGDGRRSIYMGVRRNFLSPFLTAFDFPAPFTAIGRRDESNVPAQSLAMMNDPFVLAEASRWAKRVIDQHPSPQNADASVLQNLRLTRLRSMYVMAFSREPEVAELRPLLDYLEEHSLPGEDSGELWSEVAHALLNAKEFIFLR